MALKYLRTITMEFESFKFVPSIIEPMLFYTASVCYLEAIKSQPKSIHSLAFGHILWSECSHIESQENFTVFSSQEKVCPSRGLSIRAVLLLVQSGNVD
jgi:hypothetical protein